MSRKKKSAQAGRRRTRPSASSARRWRPSRAGRARTTSTTGRHQPRPRTGRDQADLPPQDRLAARRSGRRPDPDPGPGPRPRSCTCGQVRTTASASSSSAGVVVTTASVKQPAARAASSPAGASSTTRQRSGRRPVAAAASRNGSGCRLAAGHVVGGDQHRRRHQVGRVDPGLGQRHGAGGGDGVLGSGQGASASAAPGSTTMSSTSASSSSLIRAMAACVPVLRQHGPRPRWPTGCRGGAAARSGRTRARSPRSSRTGSTAGVESIRVPSMSKITASNDLVGQPTQTHASTPSISTASSCVTVEPTILP